MMVAPLVHVLRNEIRNSEGTDRVVQICDCGHELRTWGLYDGVLPKRRRCDLCALGKPPGEMRRSVRILPVPRDVHDLVKLLPQMRESATIIYELGLDAPGSPDRISVSGRGKRAIVVANFGSLSINITAYADLGIRGIADARRWASELAGELGIEFRSETYRRRPRLRLVVNAESD